MEILALLAFRAVPVFVGQHALALGPQGAHEQAVLLQHHHVPGLPGDDAAQLAARVLAQEHRIYPRAVQWFCEGRLRIQDGRVEIAALNDGCAADAALLVP